MKILTVGVTPYLLTRNGNINLHVLMGLKEAGHSVEGLVWHHDVSYFQPNELGTHTFDGPKGEVGRLYPYLGERGGLAAFLYETLQSSQPQVVVTIGGCDETDFVWPLRSLYPKLFRWVAILPTAEVNEHQREAFQYADHLIVTTRAGQESIKTLWGLDADYVPYGHDPETYRPLDLDYRDISVLCSAKNAQISNLPAFMAAVGSSGVRATLHTNLFDDGDNDLHLLHKRLGLAGYLELPKRYVSVREGLSDPEMNELYNRHQFFVDCSMQSATALSAIEAMATGCIPIGMNIGAIGEVIGRLPAEHQYLIPHETFVGPRQEDFAIIATKELSATLAKIRLKYTGNKALLAAARSEAIKAATEFSKDLMVKRVKEVIENVVRQEHSIAVDSYQV
jgi:glycosyltransferase involved in cell wall biosynthesis